MGCAQCYCLFAPSGLVVKYRGLHFDKLNDRSLSLSKRRLWTEAALAPPLKLRRYADDKFRDQCCWTEDNEVHAALDFIARCGLRNLLSLSHILTISPSDYYLHDMSPGFARFVMRVFGWRIEGTIPESLHKYVVIAAPHTSWWDFPLGLFSRAAIGRKILFLGKDSLFKPPIGWFMRWLGGYPVDRSKHTKLVDQVISLFNQKDEFAVSLAPEGTRKRVTEFKTGFYYIARGAQVPIICVRMDYGNKRVVFSPPFYTTSNAQEDLKFLWNQFVGVRGKRPELGINENK